MTCCCMPKLKGGYRIAFLWFFVQCSVLLFGQPRHVDSEVMVIAHRGGIVEGVPENTLSAFKRSIELGVDYIEADLRASGDGEIVVFHDATLDRTTNGEGRLSEWSINALKQLDLGNGEKIPTFEELLKIASGSGVGLVLDIKASESVDLKEVLQAAGKYQMQSSIIIGVRSLEDLKTVKRMDRNVTLLGFIPGIQSVDDFIEAGVHKIRLWPEWIEEHEELIPAIHEKGVDVWMTAGDLDLKVLEQKKKKGIDGLIYDRPAALIEHLLYR